MQELYGRRRRGIQDGQERLKLPEETEIEELNRQLKEVLEHHLERLGPTERKRVAGRVCVSVSAASAPRLRPAPERR